MNFIEQYNDAFLEKHCGITFDELMFLAQIEVMEGRTFEFSFPYIYKFIQEIKFDERVYCEDCTRLA